MTFFPGCWVDRANIIGRGPCDGRLVKAHLLPKQMIRREGFAHLVWDDRAWVPLCGGISGLGGHHGQVDGKTLTIPREKLPAKVEEFAAELDAKLDGRFPFGAYLDREFGTR